MMALDHNEFIVAQILLELPEIIRISYSPPKVGSRVKRKRSSTNENLPKPLSLSPRESTGKNVIYKKIENVGGLGNNKVKALKRGLKPRKRKVSRILENEKEEKVEIHNNVELLQLFPCHPDRKTESSGNGDEPNVLPTSSSNIISSQWSEVDLRLTL